MCSENEVVLSEVHVNSVRSRTVTIESDQQLLQHFNYMPGLKVVQTRFEFTNPKAQNQNFECRVHHCAEETPAFLEKPGTSLAPETDRIVYDEDGDLFYQTSKTKPEDVIIIDHFLATPLHLVGLQVWQGSLLLADYFLHTGRTILANARLIELGAGTGFCSLVAAMFAETVFLTDYDEGILELCQRNILQNRYLFNAEVKIRKWDWCKEIDSQTSEDPRWRVNHKDEEFSNLNIVIAADVIYRDDLTDALFRTVNKLMDGTVNSFYISLEKRLNFTLDDLEVACPAYNYFLSCLKKHGFTAQQLEVNFPQYFEYNRTPQLELWLLQKKCVRTL